MFVYRVRGLVQLVLKLGRSGAKQPDHGFDGRTAFFPTGQFCHRHHRVFRERERGLLALASKVGGPLIRSEVEFGYFLICVCIAGVT